ncbi:MAG: aminotransferase class III-fold pyridoxal phosphate-dependent enzyme [Sandaracinaceae bacterium]|nr:aminotransferase class III-fold pyridoxal phosphate-dependent enzyme [Sandaracinaceae bacterium]
MPTNAELIEKARRALLPNYQPPPFVLAEGRGCRVRDVEGHEYLDFSGGIAVLSVGHAHPTLAAAIAEQAGRLLHTSNLFYNDKSIELAARLTERTVFDRVYLGNSGAEANEALLKLARRWHYEHGRPERVELVAAHQSFHGRTMGALSLTGQPKYHTGMGPLVPGITHVPYNDLEALRAAVGERTAAVLLEPIQGEGGLVVGEDDYLRGARALCDERGALLFFDEVQTGYGRTGRFLGREHSGVVPDGCSLAKGWAAASPSEPSRSASTSRTASPGEPRDHLRRQPAGRRGGPRRAPHLRRGGRGGERRPHGRAPRRGPRRARRRP